MTLQLVDNALFEEVELREGSGTRKRSSEADRHLSFSGTVHVNPMAARQQSALSFNPDISSKRLVPLPPASSSSAEGYGT